MTNTIIKSILTNGSAITTPETGVAGKYKNVTFTSGDAGGTDKGVRMMPKPVFVSFPGDAISKDSFSLTVNYKPAYTASTATAQDLRRVIFNLQSLDRSTEITLEFFNSRLSLIYRSGSQTQRVSTTANARLWSKDAWKKITCEFIANSQDCLKIFIDDIRVDNEPRVSGQLNIETVESTLFLGCIDDRNNQVAEGTLDDLEVINVDVVQPPVDPPIDPPPPPPPVSDMPSLTRKAFGVNVSQFEDWMSQYPINLMKQARGAQTGILWGGWSGGNATMSSDGWAMPATANDVSRYLVGFSANGQTIQTGRYVLLLTAQTNDVSRFMLNEMLAQQSRVTLVSDVTTNNIRRIVFDYNDAGSTNQQRGLVLAVQGPSPDPIRLSLGKLEHEAILSSTVSDSAKTGEQIWSPELLNNLAGFRALRMPWWSGAINQYLSSEPERLWARRPQMSNATWTTGAGVPWEAQIRLCRASKIVPWLCVPANTNNEYFDEFATLVANEHPEGSVIVELSVEVWNFGFLANSYFTAMAAGMPGAPAGNYQRALYAYGYRSIELLTRLAARLGDRVRMPLSGQADFGDATNNPTLEWIMAGAQAHANFSQHRSKLALSTAPYFGSWIATDTASVSAIRTGGSNAVISRMQTAATQVANQMQGALVVANRYNMPYYVYEGGQHLVLATMDATVHNAIITAQRSPEMGTIYQNFWTQVGNAAHVVAAYNLVDMPNQYGYWGALESWDLTTPKFTALRQVASVINNPVVV